MTKVSLAAISLVFILAACGGASHARSGADAAGTAKAKVGSRIVLNGRSDGEKVAVTLTKVVPFARSVWNPMDGPRPRSLRFYAARFRLTNIGSSAYSDWPSNSAQVVDSKGRSFDSYIGGALPTCGSFSAHTHQTVASGSSALVCVGWKIPRHAAITGVRFTLDSGHGPDTGQWNVADAAGGQGHGAAAPVTPPASLDSSPGACPSLPAYGELLFELPGGKLYADGDIISDRGVHGMAADGRALPNVTRAGIDASHRACEPQRRLSRPSVPASTLFARQPADQSGLTPAWRTERSE